MKQRKTALCTLMFLLASCAGMNGETSRSSEKSPCACARQEIIRSIS